MLLGFKDRFIPMVEDGSKRHTIRAGGRWKAGMRADLYARPRQKGMRLVFRAPVVKVESVRIDRSPTGVEMPGWLWVLVDGHQLAYDEAQSFFHRDGFRPEPGDPFTSMSMAAAFWCKRLAQGPFEGQLIHWDFDRREVK